MSTTRIDVDGCRAFEIRPAGDAWVAVLVTVGKPDYEVRAYPSHIEARDAAHKWAQAELEQTARLRRWGAHQED